MIKAGIIGAAGYTGGELLRLLLDHPEVDIAFAHSESQKNKPVAEVHHDLWGQTDLQFSGDFHAPVEVLFLCMGHGRSADFLQKNTFPKELKIIDLSDTFRVENETHDFIYGLPELNKKRIAVSLHIANPGCFATAMQLAVLPLAANHFLQDDLHIHAITGSTGAGQQPSDTTHFSWRNNNLSIYQAFQHRHLKEVKQSIHQLQPDFAAKVNFIPVRGNFPRGIFASLYTKTDLSLNQARQLFQDYYADAPFVFLSEQNPSLKQVVNTNRALLYLEKHDDQLLIISMIDNLLKGASGQAVQNMNVQFGFPEKAGLQLKALAF